MKRFVDLRRMRRGSQLWLVGLIAVSLAAAASLRAVDYRAEGLSTELDEPVDLKPENIHVLTEAAMTDGRTLLEVGADVRNLAEAFWEGVKVYVRDQIAGAAPKALNSIIHFTESILPGQVITNAESLFTVVNSSDLTVARNELLSGTVLQVLASTAQGVATDTTSNLVVERPRIIAETPLANGLTLIEFAANVRNLSQTNWTNISVNLSASLGSIPYRTPLLNSTYTNTLEGFSVATGMDSVLLTVSSNELTLVRSNLLSGAGLSYSGAELWVFNAFPRGIDAATEHVWRWPAESAGAGELKLVFTNVTDVLSELRAGDLLVENPSIHRLVAHAIDNPADPFDDDRKVLANYLPFSVSSVDILTNNEVHVIGRQKLLREVIKSATFVADALDAYDRPVRDPYNPTLENTYTHEEQDERDDVAGIIAAEDPRDGRLADLKGMISIPWHFNETFLSDKIKVSGELLFRQSGLKIEIKIRDFQLQRAVAHIDAGAVLNLVIECFEKEDTTDKPEDKKSKNLLPINPIPPVTFNLGGVPVTVQPELSLTAGVEANIPTSITLPLQSVFTVGMEMGFDRSLKTGTNDGFFYTPFTEFIPIRVSDPTVFDELALTLGAWAELSVGLKIGVGEGISLQAGPSLAIRLGNNFSLAPFSNPWWSLDSGVDLIGRFTMALDFMGFDPIDLIDAEASLHHFDLFHRDAGGPLIHGMRAAAVGSSSSLQPTLGRNARWGRVFEPGERFGLASAFAFAVPGSSNDVIVGGSGGVSDAVSMMAKVNAKGDLLWMKDNFPLGGPTLKKAVPLADGSFVTAGTRFFDVVISHFDKEGNRLWVTSFTPPASGFAVTQVAAGMNASGQPEFYVSGYVTHGVVTQRDPALIKVDANGALLWSYYYAMPGGDYANGMTVTSDGHVVLCGSTAADVAPPTIGVPDPGNVLKNIVASGLLMKIDSATGLILWSKAYASRWGISFNTVLEAPDHTLYAGGAAGRIVTQTRPSNLFAKFDSEGALIDHVLVGDDPDWVDELPNGGNSPYDAVQSLIWTPEGLAACGVTGLGTETAAWVLGLTEEFGVRFYTVFDGSDSEEMLQIVDAGEGLAVIGNTRTAYPLGSGGQPSPFLLKLPWEGVMRFHEDTRMRSLYLQPRVYHSSVDTEFQVLSTLKIPNAPTQTFGNTFSSATFTNVPLTMTPSSAVVAPLAPSAKVILSALERLDASAIQDYNTWAAYHQLPATGNPEDDSDGDGQPDVLESFFGQNPRISDTTSPFTISSSGTNAQPVAVIEFSRSKFGPPSEVHFESSTDLNSWVAATGFTETVEPLNNTTDRVRLTSGADARIRFFRAVADKP